VILRDYQIRLRGSIGQAFANGRRRVLAVMPTGAGKTVVFTSLEGYGSTLIVAHRRELIRQASAKLAEAGVAHGVIAPGWPANDAPVQVGSIQTVARRLGELPQFRLVIIDEAHHAAAGQYRKLIEAQADARLLGVTATPERLDGRGLGDVFEHLVSGPAPSELIAAGYLVPPRVFAPDAPDLATVPVRAGDYAAEPLGAVMGRPGVVGDAIEHYAWHAPTQPAIAFCPTVKHAEETAAAFCAAGWRARAVSGAMPVEERDAVFAGLADGSVEVVTSCDLISEGLDIPNVSCVVLLRPTMSLGLFLQMVGRGLRPAPGKRFLTVLDHAGNTWRHGLPSADRRWSLDAGKASRPKTAPAIRQCESCYAIFAPAPRCPACGAGSVRATPRRRVRRADGELVEITEAEERLRSAPLRELVSKARSLAELEAIREARGYAENWPAVMMQHKRVSRGRYVGS